MQLGAVLIYIFYLWVPKEGHEVSILGCDADLLCGSVRDSCGGSSKGDRELIGRRLRRRCVRVSLVLLSNKVRSCRQERSYMHTFAF